MKLLVAITVLALVFAQQDQEILLNFSTFNLILKFLIYCGLFYKISLMYIYQNFLMLEYVHFSNNEINLV